MSRVGLSRKNAQAIFDVLTRKLNQQLWPEPEYVTALRAALKPKPKSSLRKKTEKQKRTYGAALSALRSILEARANGRCEFCGEYFSMMDRAEADHFFGKARVAQSVRNVWLIHSSCHRAKGANSPTARYWLEAFIVHCDSLGFFEESAMARRRLDALKLVKLATAVSK